MRPRTKTKSGVVRATRFPIRDFDGNVVAVHVRLDRADGTKDFVWEQPDGSKGLGGVRVKDLPLYGTELLRGAPEDEPAILVEGESTANALRDLGCPLVLATVTGASVTPSADVFAVLGEAARPLLAGQRRAGRLAHAGDRGDPPRPECRCAHREVGRSPGDG